jgi:hypothetical protein
MRLAGLGLLGQEWPVLNVQNPNGADEQNPNGLDVLALEELPIDEHCEPDEKMNLRKQE